MAWLVFTGVQAEAQTEPDAPSAGATEPLAGFSDGVAFLRAPDNSLVIFPGGRVQVDGLFFASEDPTPRHTFLLRRAQLELSGWVGALVYFTIAGDFAASPPSEGSRLSQANLNTTDSFVAIAPCGDRAILQVGQFDAPFTLENRTSNKSIDFMERSITVRAFGIPRNKELGAMLHGTNPERSYGYALALLNGDGSIFRNLDDNFDVMARAWVAPLGLGGVHGFARMTVGGSFWTGDRNQARALASQTTQGGFRILDPRWTSGSATGPPLSVDLHEHGRLFAGALELNLPFTHRLGLRYELVSKRQPLSALEAGASASTSLADFWLRGIAMYIEGWWWVVGDDRIIGQPGLQLPPRYAPKANTIVTGLMLAARIEHLDERISARNTASTLGSPVIGNTTITAYQLGINYWRSRRFRATFNYGMNRLAGDTDSITGLKSRSEHEFMFRLGIAL